MEQKNYAFFDVDDTIVSVKTMFSFQDYWYTQNTDVEGRERFETDMLKRHNVDASWEMLNRLYYRHFAGRSIADVKQCGIDWFNTLENTHKNLFNTAVVKELQELQNAGNEIVFVSGSFPALLNPIAQRLNVEHILAIQMQEDNGYYTGDILMPQTIGEGKAEAIELFLRNRNTDRQSCHAYGDDISDLPMLKSVGKPTVVSGGRGLEDYANKVGWRVIAPN